mmetsp:Transcript_2690/g.7375  ORF Transcript_2690/g.7375 Transcript_2690/m.7375 type:complete len:215 (+) Transcript_2690:70-714(+)
MNGVGMVAQVHLAERVSSSEFSSNTCCVSWVAKDLSLSKLLFMLDFSSSSCSFWHSSTMDFLVASSSSALSFRMRSSFFASLAFLLFASSSASSEVTSSVSSVLSATTSAQDFLLSSTSSSHSFLVAWIGESKSKALGCSFSSVMVLVLTKLIVLRLLVLALIFLSPFAFLAFFDLVIFKASSSLDCRLSNVSSPSSSSCTAPSPFEVTSASLS